MGALDGLRVVEFEGIGPVPYAGMLLSDMGAEVIRVARRPPASPSPVLDRGRTIVAADLKRACDRLAVERLIASADILIEGFRPGVLERLGLGPDRLHQANPGLVIGRMTGWGQEGPMRAMAGHDLNYIAMTGALAAIGPRERPAIPLNLIGDYGGGSLHLVMGVLAAYVSRLATRRGQVIDCAMTDGATSLLTVLFDAKARGRWPGGRGENVLDGGAPFYDVYACADGLFVALAAIEPHFFKLFCEMAGLPAASCLMQDDRAAWPELRGLIARRLAQKSRGEWAAIFAGTDACLVPVLDIDEAVRAEANAARDMHATVYGVVQPPPAPRFSATPSQIGPARHVSLLEADWASRD